MGTHLPLPGFSSEEDFRNRLSPQANPSTLLTRTLMEMLSPDWENLQYQTGQMMSRGPEDVGKWKPFGLLEEGIGGLGGLLFGLGRGVGDVAGAIPGYVGGNITPEEAGILPAVEQTMQESTARQLSGEQTPEPMIDPFGPLQDLIGMVENSPGATYAPADFSKSMSTYDTMLGEAPTREDVQSQYEAIGTPQLQGLSDLPAGFEENLRSLLAQSAPAPLDDERLRNQEVLAALQGMVGGSRGAQTVADVLAGMGAGGLAGDLQAQQREDELRQRQQALQRDFYGRSAQLEQTLQGMRQNIEGSQKDAANKMEIFSKESLRDALAQGLNAERLRTGLKEGKAGVQLQEDTRNSIIQLAEAQSVEDRNRIALQLKSRLAELKATLPLKQGKLNFDQRVKQINSLPKEQQPMAWADAYVEMGVERDSQQLALSGLAGVLSEDHFLAQALLGDKYETARNQALEAVAKRYGMDSKTISAKMGTETFKSIREEFNRQFARIIMGNLQINAKNWVNTLAGDQYQLPEAITIKQRWPEIFGR